MKLAGAFLLLVSAVLFSYEKCNGLKRHLIILEELLRFIERVRVEICCYLKPITDIADDFSSEILSEIGFLSDIRKYGAHKAYINLRPRLMLSEKENKVLDSFFSRIGTAYAEDEIKLIDITVSQMTDFVRSEREKLPKQKKLYLTLSCAASLGVVILLI